MDGNSFVLSKDDPNTVNLLFLALKFLQQYDEVSDSVAGLELALVCFTFFYSWTFRDFA